MLKSTNIRVLFLKTVSLYSRATSFFSVRQEGLQKVDIISYSILKKILPAENEMHHSFCYLHKFYHKKKKDLK